MQRDSIYRAAHDTASEYREDIVKRLGPGHNEAATAEWNQQRFWMWAIDRAIEHVEGRVYWHECGKRNFSRVSQRPELERAIRKVRKLQNRLVADGLPTFRQKEDILNELARLANQLLE